VAVKVSLEVPAPVIEAGLKAAVTPAGSPVAVRAIAELKPPVTAVVMVEVPVAPGATVTVVGAADRENPDAPEGTVKVTVAVWVMEPLVPVTVIE
jgi:hypothetical protein